MKNSALFPKLIALLETHEIENVIGIGEPFLTQSIFFRTALAIKTPINL